jgi:hypothetical protein
MDGFGFMLLMGLVMVCMLKCIPGFTPRPMRCQHCGGALRFHWPDCKKVKNRRD